MRRFGRALAALAALGSPVAAAEPVKIAPHEHGFVADVIRAARVKWA